VLPCSATSEVSRMTECAAASQVCTGSSTKLPQDQCDAWGDFYVALGGDGWDTCKVSMSQAGLVLKTDPCSCTPEHGAQAAICNSDGTTVVEMCVTHRRRRRSAVPAPPSRHLLPLPCPSRCPLTRCYPLAAPFTPPAVVCHRVV
jgi:hypothetical protein